MRNKNNNDSLIYQLKTYAYTEKIINDITRYANNTLLMESVSNEADKLLFDKLSDDGVSKLIDLINNSILTDESKISVKQRLLSEFASCEKLQESKFTLVSIYRVISTSEAIISDMCDCIVSNDFNTASEKIDLCRIATSECRRLIASLKTTTSPTNPMKCDSDSETIDVDTMRKRVESISFKELFEDVKNRLADIKSILTNSPTANSVNRIIFIKWEEAYANYLLALKDAIYALVDYYYNTLRSRTNKSEANMTVNVIENVFDPIDFKHGFYMFEEDITQTVKKADEEIKMESSDGVVGKVRNVIAALVKKIKDFFAELRAKVISKYKSKKAEKAIREIDEAISTNPDILNAKIEYVDYDALLAQCEDAKKAIEERMNAYSKLYADNKVLLEKEELTSQEAKHVEKIEKQLKEIAYGEGKWSKKKIMITASVATAAAVTITGASLYAKYKSSLSSFDKDLASVASDSDTITNFQNQVGISTRTSGYSISIAEEYAKILNTEGQLFVNKLSELVSKLGTAVSSGGGRIMSNVASAVISGSKYLESFDLCNDDLLMTIYEEMGEDCATTNNDGSTDTNVDKNEAPINKVDDVSEDADDYDPMNGLF